MVIYFGIKDTQPSLTISASGLCNLRLNTFTSDGSRREAKKVQAPGADKSNPTTKNNRS